MFIIQHEISENRELKDKLAELEALANQINQRKISKNNPPVARDGYKMVPHGDHWHEVPIDAPDTWEDVQTADVPTENGQTSEEPDLFVGDNTPIDEDFYREYIIKYSRERLEANVKSSERLNEYNRTEYIPALEESLKKKLEWLHDFPDCEHTQKRIAEIETEINLEQGRIRRSEEMNRMASKVLNEEANNVEK
ncbi:hypothetical protein F4083_00355 [Candidatus Poribacteria bacterium]|nr:hypothetical protein [Candidatus Poribacteria bacterium]